MGKEVEEAIEDSPGRITGLARFLLLLHRLAQLLHSKCST